MQSRILHVVLLLLLLSIHFYHRMVQKENGILCLFGHAEEYMIHTGALDFRMMFLAIWKVLNFTMYNLFGHTEGHLILQLFCLLHRFYNWTCCCFWKLLMYKLRTTSYIEICMQCIYRNLHVVLFTEKERQFTNNTNPKTLNPNPKSYLKP